MSASQAQNRTALVSKKQRKRTGQLPCAAASATADTVMHTSDARTTKFGLSTQPSGQSCSYATTMPEFSYAVSSSIEPSTGSGAAHSDISLTSHPFGQMPDPDPSQLWQQINECLDGLCGKKTVVEQLLEKGHSELLAQRACLEVFHSRKHVDLEATETWIRTQGPDAPHLDELVKPEDRTRYQDIALAVAKVACLYSNASLEASSGRSGSPESFESGAARARGASSPPPSYATPGSPGTGMGSGTSAKKALKLLKAAGKDGNGRNGARVGDGLTPQVLLQALPPQVWTSLQDSAGEVLQAMASAVDRAMDHPGLSSTVEASPAAASSSGPGSTNVTCIAMPVSLSPPPPVLSQTASSTTASTRGPHLPASPALLPHSPTSPTARPPLLLGDSLAAAVSPEAETEELRAYKSWAEAKIALLIQRTRNIELTRREEAARSSAEAAQLRKDKEALEGRMAEYGAGLVKLKEASFQDAAARREGQRALQAAHAELKGASLREQEVAAQALQASQALKAERRRTLAVEKQLKASNEARAEAAAAAVRAAEELEAGRAEGERSKRLAEERAALVVQAENAAVEARQQCDMQVRVVVGEQERLRGEVQELTSSLAAARSRACDADAAAADSAAEVAQLQAQLLAAQQVVAEAVARGDHSRSASQASDRSAGCYDHWTGSSLFTADAGAACLSGAFGSFAGAPGGFFSRRGSPASQSTELGAAWAPGSTSPQQDSTSSPLWGTPRGNGGRATEVWGAESDLGKRPFEGEDLWGSQNRLFAELPRHLNDVRISH